MDEVTLTKDLDAERQSDEGTFSCLLNFPGSYIRRETN